MQQPVRRRQSELQQFAAKFSLSADHARDYLGAVAAAASRNVTIQEVEAILVGGIIDVTQVASRLAPPSTTRPLSPDQFIKRYQIRQFYHFTDPLNLDGIKANGGLLSRSEQRRVGVDVAAPGGNDWSQNADTAKGMHLYVHLCFLPQHPMAHMAVRDGRISKPRFLEIDPRVLLISGVLFTSAVSNKRGVQPLTLAKACQEMDFDLIYGLIDGTNPDVIAKRKAAEKYEILIPTEVPLKYIRGL